jgi:hypothetical protein
MSNGFLLLAALVGAAAFFVVVACFLWYAAALSRVFARCEVEPWRAWVPVLNEAEVLRLGGFAPGLVVLFFIPIVAIYAYVVRIIAVHRVNTRLGHGAGATVLGAVLPPVWATVLAWGRSASAARAPSTAAVSPAESDAASGGARPTGGLIAPPPSAVAAAQPESEPEVAAEPEVVAEPEPPAAEVPVADVAPEGEADAAAAPEQAQVPIVDTILTDTILMMRAQMESPEPEPEPEPEPVPAPPSEDGEEDPDVTAERVSPASVPADAIDDETIVVGLPILEETVVVPRRPAIWRLETAEGGEYVLSSDRVVVGRRPGDPDPGAQSIALADSGRTLSKRHAVLTYDGEVWLVEDLHSTNGVTLIDESGREELLAPGEPTPATQEMLFGRLGVLLTRSEG